ncbi:unannotated protein [freshwater metagenome]|uniref:Unannotated protein n=1 Tax=freshwater metagenome TaxID=449393 RepID=A0A6J7INQ5_9ZZZZ
MQVPLPVEHHPALLGRRPGRPARTQQPEGLVEPVGAGRGGPGQGAQQQLGVVGVRPVGQLGEEARQVGRRGQRLAPGARVGRRRRGALQVVAGDHVGQHRRAVVGHPQLGRRQVVGAGEGGVDPGQVLGGQRGAGGPGGGEDALGQVQLDQRRGGHRPVDVPDRPGPGRAPGDRVGGRARGLGGLHGRDGGDQRADRTEPDPRGPDRRDGGERGDQGGRLHRPDDGDRRSLGSLGLHQETGHQRRGDRDRATTPATHGLCTTHRRPGHTPRVRRPRTSAPGWPGPACG